MKETEAYENLANAIIRQACEDWLSCTYVNEEGEHINPRQETINRNEIEAFFHSEWFTALTKTDPDWLIERLKQIDINEQSRSHKFTCVQY